MHYQALFFIAEHGTRIEFGVQPVGDQFAMTSRFQPPREEDASTFATTDELADEIERLVKEHLSQHGARLLYIRRRHVPDIVSTDQLGRYAVPLFDDDTGARDAPGQAGE